LSGKRVPGQECPNNCGNITTWHLQTEWQALSNGDPKKMAGMASRMLAGKDAGRAFGKLFK